MRRFGVIVLAATALLIVESAGAQGTVPNGAFVKDAAGDVWLVLGDQRLRVPIYPSDEASLAAIPDSGKWAVPALGGGVAAGERPEWANAAAASPAVTSSPQPSPLPPSQPAPAPAAGPSADDLWAKCYRTAHTISAETDGHFPVADMLKWCLESAQVDGERGIDCWAWSLRQGIAVIRRSSTVTAKTIGEYVQQQYNNCAGHLPR